MASIALSAVGTYFGGPVGGAIGQALGSYIDQALFSKEKKLPDQIGPRISDLSVQFSSYGQVIPTCYGRVRTAGNVIWARDIKEVESRSATSSGGKGGVGGGASQTTITYEYFATLAIAVSEGEIDSIEKIWADSKIISSEELSESAGKYNVYKGTETQNPDSIMESYDGSGNVPAYRGIAYIVIEDFPLAAFGNRVPNFTFEVKRTLDKSNSVENKVKEICMIPGSGEFVYSTEEYFYQEGYDLAGKFIQNSGRNSVNLHSFKGKADAEVAVEQMLETFPNLEYVALVVSWFATSTDAGNCQIIPKVEYNYSIASGRNLPDEWSVAGYTKGTASNVLRLGDGSLTYGGTPSDKSIIQICQLLQDKGIKVMLYPFILVDQLTPSLKPWRGRITPANTTDANSFFTKTKGYNDFVLHYANLSVGGTNLKDIIDGFVIGSEMVGMTSFTETSGVYPAVTKFASLASSVKAVVGSGVTVTYAADWSEYHSQNGYYNMDELWVSSGIDVVGIDAYFPITPDLEQNDITKDKIKEYWEKGEGFDYYYTDSEARTGKTNYPNAEFAWKNLEYWWSNDHDNSGTPTGWTAKLKPVWFTEFGFPSVDACANQPNVFVDANSDESAYPRLSKQRVDYTAQREAIEATLEYLQDRNGESGLSNLVPKSFLWTWDARPYPFFPDLSSVWADGVNWKYGHWVQGKLGSVKLSDIVEDLLKKVNFSESQYDVSELSDSVEGFIISDRQTIRDAISLLASAYFFDAVESDGKIKFVKRGKTPDLIIEEDELVPLGNGNIRQTTEKVRRADLELPKSVDISYISRVSNFNTGTQNARRQTVSAEDNISLNLPIVISDQTAKNIADISLYTAWQNRTIYKFNLPAKYQYLEPTDLVSFSYEGEEYNLRLLNLSLNRSIEIEAVSEEASTYDFYIDASEIPTTEASGGSTPETTVHLLDIPMLPGDSDGLGTLRLAVTGESDNWKGCNVYFSNDGGEQGGNNFDLLTSIESRATIGFCIDDISGGNPYLLDSVAEIEVQLPYGELESIQEDAFYNASNIQNHAIIGNEIISYNYATLISEGKYKLTGVLRGRLGTEHEIDNHEAGDRFILLNSAIEKVDVPLSYINNPVYYKAVTFGDTIANTSESQFTYLGEKLKPWSVHAIDGSRNSSGDITINWIRRGRISSGWFTPLSEESEQYEIDILDGSGDVIRTEAVTQATYTYTEAKQIEDFTSLQSSVDVNVYQISAVVGRGNITEATV